MVVVGCDFGLRRTGVVVLGEDFQVLSQNLIDVGLKSKGAKRLVEIEKAFCSVVLPYQDDGMHFFIEGYAYGAKYQRESLAELGGVMRRYFYINKYDYWVVPPTSVKSFVTGTGKASKNYMKKCTKDKWDLSFKSDDVCDAHGLARLGMTVMKVLEGNIMTTSEEEGAVVHDILHNIENYRSGNTARRATRRRKK